MMFQNLLFLGLDENSPIFKSLSLWQEKKDKIKSISLSKMHDSFYKLPLTVNERFLLENSSLEEYEIRDLQHRLKRKLRFSELAILKLTSEHGLMIRDGDFQP